MEERIQHAEDWGDRNDVIRFGAPAACNYVVPALPPNSRLGVALLCNAEGAKELPELLNEVLTVAA